ncbi:MAG: hypothetical protein WDA07_14255 [Leucobacter sp.]
MYGDWILTYPGVEYRFGPPDHTVELVGWTFQADGSRNDDTPAPRMDGIIFGEDFLEAGRLQIDVKIDFTTHPVPVETRAQLAWEARQAFSEAWRADVVRSRPGAVAELTMGGEVAFEGRPRPVAWDDDAQNVGLIYGSALFVPAGTGVFDVTGPNAGWRTVSVQLVPPEVGAWVFPLTFPVSGTTAAVRASVFEVGGTASAWPVIEVDGPIQSGASVEVTGEWSVTLNRGLAYDETARLDTRPGQRSMTVNGRPVNLLVPSSPSLADLSLSPGPHQVALRGSSLEGTAVARLRWRDTKAGV